MTGELEGSDQIGPNDIDPEATQDYPSVPEALKKMQPARSERHLLPGETNLTYRSVANFLKQQTLHDYGFEEEAESKARGFRRRYTFYSGLIRAFPPSKFLTPEQKERYLESMPSLFQQAVEVDNPKKLEWFLVQRGAFLYARIFGGKRRKTVTLRLYLNLDPSVAIITIRNLTSALVSQSIPADIKITLKSPEREDGAVVYCDVDEAPRVVSILQRLFEQAPARFIPSGALAFAAPVQWKGQPLPGVRIGQDEGSSQSFHQRRDEALDCAVIRGVQAQAIAIESQSNQFGSVDRIVVIDESAWEDVVRKAMIECNVNPDRPYLSQLVAPRVLGVINPLVAPEAALPPTDQA